MASITVSRPMPEQITPLHLSLDGALLLSLIDPLHLTGHIVDAHEVAAGLITVESTPDGWFGDYRITAWVPLGVNEAENRQHEALIDPDLIDPDGRLPLVLGATVADVANADHVPAVVREAREYLIDRAAHAAASYVRRPAMTS